MKCKITDLSDLTEITDSYRMIQGIKVRVIKGVTIRSKNRSHSIKASQTYAMFTATLSVIHASKNHLTCSFKDWRNMPNFQRMFYVVGKTTTNELVLQQAPNTY